MQTDIIDLLTRLKEYMDARADSIDGETIAPNKEMKFSLEIEQALVELDPKEDDFIEKDEKEFEMCIHCDGHDACEDFGCAVKNGLGHLLKNNL